MPKHSPTLFALIFMMLTSMTNCEKMEGPSTTVKGSITDYSTKEGYANITLQITRISGNWSGSRNYTDLDTVVTNSEGNYELTFIPIGVGTFSIDYKDRSYRKDYSASVDSGSKELKLGETNIVNFKSRKLVNLHINLKNNSSEIRNTWSFSVASAGFSTYVQLNPITKDTSLSFKVSRLSNTSLNSFFYNEGVTGSQTMETNQVYIGEKDTTIQMVHK